MAIFGGREGVMEGKEYKEDKHVFFDSSHKELLTDLTKSSITITGISQNY